MFGCRETPLPARRGRALSTPPPPPARAGPVRGRALSTPPPPPARASPVRGLALSAGGPCPRFRLHQRGQALSAGALTTPPPPPARAGPVRGRALSTPRFQECGRAVRGHMGVGRPCPEVQERAPVSSCVDGPCPRFGWQPNLVHGISGIALFEQSSSLRTNRLSNLFQSSADQAVVYDCAKAMYSTLFVEAGHDSAAVGQGCCIAFAFSGLKLATLLDSKCPTLNSRSLGQTQIPEQWHPASFAAAALAVMSVSDSEAHSRTLGRKASLTANHHHAVLAPECFCHYSISHCHALVPMLWVGRQGAA